MSAQARLFELKKKMEEAQQEHSRLEGQKEQLMKQLEEKFGCKSVRAANTKLNKLGEQSEELSAKITTALEDLEASYDFSAV